MFRTNIKNHKSSSNIQFRLVLKTSFVMILYFFYFVVDNHEKYTQLVRRLSYKKNEVKVNGRIAYADYLNKPSSLEEIDILIKRIGDDTLMSFIYSLLETKNQLNTCSNALIVHRLYLNNVEINKSGVNIQ